MPFVVEKIKDQVDQLIEMELANYQAEYKIKKKKAKKKKKKKAKKAKKVKFPGDA